MLPCASQAGRGCPAGRVGAGVCTNTYTAALAAALHQAGTCCCWSWCALHTRHTHGITVLCAAQTARQPACWSVRWGPPRARLCWCGADMSPLTRHTSHLVCTRHSVPAATACHLTLFLIGLCMGLCVGAPSSPDILDASGLAACTPSARFCCGSKETARRPCWLQVGCCMIAPQLRWRGCEPHTTLKLCFTAASQAACSCVPGSATGGCMGSRDLIAFGWSGGVRYGVLVVVVVVQF